MSDPAPAGWSFPTGRRIRFGLAPKGRDWLQLESVVLRLASSGYAVARATPRRKAADIMRTFDLGYADALRCLRVAQGLPLSGGKHWERRAAWIPKGYPQAVPYSKCGK